MGKKARQKWERRVAALESALRPKPNPVVSHAWMGSFLTFTLAGCGMAVSNAPWQLSALLFLMALLSALVTASLTFKNSHSWFPRLLVTFLVTVITILETWGADTLIRVPVTLDDRSRAKFTATLKASPQKPDYVLLSCSNTDENACALAEQFIPLLQRAGWKVDGPKVDKVTLGMHSRDVVIADYGPPLVYPQNPDLGVWTKLMPWRLYELSAFGQLGIEVKVVNDPNLSETRTRIYFGTVPTNSLFATVRLWLS